LTYRIAKSLDTYRSQITEAYPNRSTASDGWIGDPAHSARESDHNPDEDGVVRALDVTHDPKNGCDCDALVVALTSAKDPRIKYIIWNERIISGATGPVPWVSRPYTGTNPHTKHMHLSVVADSRADSTRKWAIPERKGWDEMASKKEIEEVVRKVVRDELQKQRRMLAVGKDESYAPSKVNLKTAIERSGK
jgi:hypothetical protein